MTASSKAKPRIQRSFGDISQEGFADIEQASVLARMRWSGAIGWDKLLESQRILIISEAGAGKTYECRTQQQTLWSRGDPAFYLELAQLAANNLRDLLLVDEEARFNAWLSAQSGVATFFLDSVDELKLTLGSFEIALKRLSKAVAGQLGRVRIVITTRPIAIDQQLIQKYFPVPDPIELTASGKAFADIAMGRGLRKTARETEAIAPIWRNVTLMPLSDDQIREMAVIQGVEDAGALLTDIRARNAEDFARRPQDLVELCADWREHHRVRLHSEQVAHNIGVKLKPRTDRQESAQLSPDKAFEGASRLALAVLLTRKLTIQLGAEANQGGEPGNSLDPSLVLHDWTAEELKTLLERALFGFASYGLVRFHHRSVVEFLAAQRLRELLGQGMPIKAVKRLLFAESSQSIKVVRPTMRPVAAWLATSKPSIFSELCIREPQVLLNHADPESLPLSQKIDALRCYVQHHGQGGWRGLRAPRVQVHRFATPDLAPLVQSLWQAGIENQEIRELLLQLIGAGPMPTCAEFAYDVANDMTATHSERLDATIALLHLDDPRVQALTKSITGMPERWPDGLVRSAVVQMFPQHIAPDSLCRILGRVQEAENTVDELRWMLPHSIGELEFTPGYLEALRTGLTDLIAEGLVWGSEWPHLVSNRPHLIPMLAAVCHRLIHNGKAEIETLRSSVIALRLGCDDYDHKEPMQKLRAAFSELPTPLREKIFWADDTFVESLHSETDPWSRLCRTFYRGPLDLNVMKDGAWMQRVLADTDRPLSERTMMLHALLREISDGDWSAHIERLKLNAADQPELLALIDRSIALKEADPETTRLKAKMEQDRQAREKLEAKRHADWTAFWHEVAEHPETAFSPDSETGTAWDLWQVMRRSGIESRASGWDRPFIEKSFSKEIADRLRTSMLKIWRNDRPTLRYERPANEKGTFLVRWQLGLTAIYAEAEDVDWARKLSDEEAELAARYAPLELNGFPAWLEALAREHPAAVERTLGLELTTELNEIAAPHSFAICLQNISYAPPAVTEVFLERLRAWLDGHSGSLREAEDEVAAIERLERVIDILLESGDEDTRKHIHSMAEDQLQVTEIGLFTQAWLTTLMRLDPAKGVDTLDYLLAPIEPAATSAAVSIFGTMFGDRHSKLRIDLGSSGFTPALLLRLSRLAYLHVRPSDDITHEGVYSPGFRDHAQSGRSVLFNAFLNTKGAEAWAVKLEMAADPLFIHFRDRLMLLAREKAAEETDNAVLTEPEVAILNRYGEAPPTTQEDMFAVLVDRLDDLEDLLLQDISPRDAWALIKDEKIMRREIARELKNSSNGVYIVDQESVTADEKETDIRLRALSGQQGTIELKLGENWSGPVLRDTIKHQLVTRYMAAESCRSGCLLITVASNCRWQHPDTAEMLDIQGLRAMLEAEAARVVNEMGDCLRLAIKVLDLRPRLGGGVNLR